MKPWYRQKTFWAAIALIATGVMQMGGVFGLDLSAEQMEAVLAILAGVGAIFLRQSVEDVKRNLP